MDKVKALLEKSGMKPELVSAICESLTKHKAQVEAAAEQKFKARLDEAKKICVQESENHKRDMARRLQIFCETKNASIEAALNRKALKSESEAQVKLESIAAALAGVQPKNGESGNRPAVLGEAKEQFARLTKERDQAVAAANRQTQIATRVVEQNKKLALENVELKRRRDASPAKPQSQTISRPQRSVSTRPTLAENAARPTRTQPQTQTPPARQTDFTVNNIAARMEVEL
jgi:phage anti-repressor protein